MSSVEPVSVDISRKQENSLIPLVVILGPTAVGKSQVALELAVRLDGEIVSADSRLFYRGMDIGTAKPSLEERRRVPHHLIDVADPNQVWSLALFLREAHKAIVSIHDRYRLPFLVGGTGQFVRSMIEGWSVPSVVPNPHLREVLTHWGGSLESSQLHGKLAILDPNAANAIDPSNLRRTIRALEVIFSTGRRFSEQRERGRTLYSPLMLGLTCPRAELYRRIDERIAHMMASGFIEEVQRLLAQGFSPYLPTMSAIGYGEIVAYIEGRINLDEAVSLMKRRTRTFVRRQANWFKLDDPRIHWFQAGDKAVHEMEKTIQEWLAGINSHKNLQKS